VHLKAAGIPKPSIHALTPPQVDHMDSHDINVRGPGGLTPLMIASMSKHGMEFSHPDPMSGMSVVLDGGAAAIISDLLAEGAATDTRMDRTGKLFFFSGTVTTIYCLSLRVKC